MHQQEFPDHLEKPGRMCTGTTVMAMVCSDGVVLAADSRATTGGYVAVRDTQKILPITDNIYCAISGDMADCQQLCSLASYYMNVIDIFSDGKKPPSVAITAHSLRKTISYNSGFLAQLLVAGVDDTGPHVFAIMQSGMAVEREFGAGGSGSTYITSYCDHYFHSGMSVDEAGEFALRAVNHATIRDGYSGGPICIVKITRDGAKTQWFKPQDQPLTTDIVKT